MDSVKEHVDREKTRSESPPGVVVENVITRDGLPVHPQPTRDPLDPLNWSSFQKNSILGIVMFFSSYFLFTYVSTTTLPSFPDLQDQYQISYEQVNWTVAIPALGLAVGPLIWSSLADIYGRRIIIILGTLITLAATLGAAAAPSYGGYMAARFFQGLGLAPASTVGLAVINDMFFEHERGQKIGLWVLAIDCGVPVGPVVGGFMNLVSAAWIQWLTALLLGVLLVLEVLFMPETLYPRRQMLTRLPVATSGDIEKMQRARSTRNYKAGDVVVDLPRTKKLSFVNFKPVPGMRHPKPWDSVVRCLFMSKFAVVTMAVFAYCFLWYWWILSVITMLPAAYVDYAPDIQGLLFIGLLLGTLFAEIFLGGRLLDWLSNKIAKRNHGIRIPESRLWLMYPGGIISAVGLIVWGISIDNGYHWMVGQIAFFLFAAGVQMGNTAVCAYIVDSYPLQSMSVITFYSVFLNLSAFIEPFFIVTWQVGAGWTWCFAVQAIIVVFGALPLFALLQMYGPRIRLKNGEPGWVNPEIDTFGS